MEQIPALVELLKLRPPKDLRQIIRRPSGTIAVVPAGRVPTQNTLLFQVEPGTGKIFSRKTEKPENSSQDSV